MHNYRHLDIWKRSISLTSLICERTINFPESEKFRLASQMRRSAVSISSNIAEGSGRKSNKEFAQFLSIAIGSCFELETQLIISKNLKFMNDDSDLVKELNEIQKMIHALIKTFAKV